MVIGNRQKELNLEKRLFIIGVIFYVVIFFLYYPPIFAFRDESSYLSMAYVLKNGTLFIENNKFPFGYADIGQLKNHRNVYIFYPLGQPLLLMPLTFLGWKSVFLLGIGFHLLGFLVFLKLMRLFKIESPFLSLLYLFFPAFILYSRTIMSDIISTVFFLIAFYFYFKPTGSKFISGLFFGITMLIRFANIALIAVTLSILIIKAIRKGDYRNILCLLSGVAPFIVLIVVLNYNYYGSLFLIKYFEKFPGFEFFSLTYLLPNLKHYLISLMFGYPFMLLTVFFAKKSQKSEIYLTMILFVIFYSLYYFYDRFPTKFLTYIFGIRFLFPLIPFILLSYIESLNKILQRFPQIIRNLLIFFILIFLLSSDVVINHQHQQFLKKQLVLRDTIYKNTEEGSVIIYDRNTVELLQRAWGERIYIRYDGYTNLSEHLKKINARKNIYLVKRDFLYAGKYTEEGISEQEVIKIGQYYRVRKIAQEAGLEVFRLDGKS